MVFSNNPKDFFTNINQLPEVLVDILYSFIPISVTMFFTKENYLTNHYRVREFINIKKLEQYIREMVRQDNNFVFNQLLVENYGRWLNMKKYYYKECIYSNYLNFIESYAVDNQSTKCIKLIKVFLEEQGLSKNQHKKKTSRYIRWKL